MLCESQFLVLGMRGGVTSGNAADEVELRSPWTDRIRPHPHDHLCHLPLAGPAQP
jgi:hypothetical protein